MQRFYLAELGPGDRRYQEISRASAWLPWLQAVLPGELDCDVTDRLASNLKHILVGLEMKAALIIPHHQQPTGRPLLFESYAQMLHFEFCVGAFSVAEGIGSAYHLVATNRDGSNGDRVYSRDWRAALLNKFDTEDTRDLGLNIDSVKRVRDKLHQDSIGARERVDWHSFTFLNAFCPAYTMLETLFAVEQDLVPRTTNLVWEE